MPFEQVAVFWFMGKIAENDSRFFRRQYRLIISQSHTHLIKVAIRPAATPENTVPHSGACVVAWSRANGLNSSPSLAMRKKMRGCPNSEHSVLTASAVTVTPAMMVVAHERPTLKKKGGGGTEREVQR